MSKRSCPFDNCQRQTKMRIRETDVNKNSAENMLNIYGKIYNSIDIIISELLKIYI